MIRVLLLILLAASSTASAVVIRHDVDDSKYRVPASEFPALVDMPGEGHGVLIAPQWVITAAHTIPGSYDLQHVVINGVSREGARCHAYGVQDAATGADRSGNGQWRGHVDSGLSCLI